MPYVSDRHDGRGLPRAVDFPDCFSEELRSVTVIPLQTEPADIRAFAESLAGFARICRFPDGLSSKFGYYRQLLPEPLGEPSPSAADTKAYETSFLPVKPETEGEPFDITGALIVAVGAVAAAGLAALAFLGIRRAASSASSSGKPGDPMLDEILRDVRDSTILPGDPFEEDKRPPPLPAKGRTDPRSGSDSVTTAWDRRAKEIPPEPGAERLLDGMDIDIPPAPPAGGFAEGAPERPTLPAPPPDDRVLAELPGREAQWEAFEKRDQSLPETRALSQLAGQMRTVPLYAGLGREDVERRAEYHFERWRAVDEATRESLLRSAEPGALFVAGEELIPHMWIMKQEAALNARLRLDGNPLYASMPEYETSRVVPTTNNRFKMSLAMAQFDRLFPGSVVQTDIDHDRSVMFAVKHDGPARLVVRSALALVSRYGSAGEVPEEVFSKEGLARILVAHSPLKPAEKLADRLSRMIEFSSKSANVLLMEARTFLRTWMDIPVLARRRILAEEARERAPLPGGPRNLYHTERRTLSEEDSSQIRRFEEKSGAVPPAVPDPRGLTAAAGALDHPPDSWLRWQRLEKNAWLEASRSRATEFSSEAREIHRQLYVENNPDFVGMKPEDRFSLCSLLARRLEAFKESNTFRELYMNPEGYISPEGIARLMNVSDAPPGARPGLVSRESGLRLKEWMRAQNHQKLSKPTFSVGARKLMPPK